MILYSFFSQRNIKIGYFLTRTPYESMLKTRLKVQHYITLENFLNRVTQSGYRCTKYEEKATSNNIENNM